jgi:hypothetical protein
LLLPAHSRECSISLNPAVLGNAETDCAAIGALPFEITASALPNRGKSDRDQRRQTEDTP